MDASRPRKKTKFADVKPRALSERLWAYDKNDEASLEIEQLNQSRERRLLVDHMLTRNVDPQETVDSESNDDPSHLGDNCLRTTKRKNSYDSTSSSEAGSFTGEEVCRTDDRAQSIEDEETEELLHLETNQTLHAEIVRKELADEAHRSLNLLSSFLGNSSPVKSDSNEATNSVEPVRLKVFEEATKTRNVFEPVERFWGSPEAVLKHTEDSTVTDEKTGFSAQWGALKSVFHDRETTSKGIPINGFAKTEDPLSLSGFTQAAERESKTQKYSFGFSFSSLQSTHESADDDEMGASDTKKTNRSTSTLSGGEPDSRCAAALDLWSGLYRWNQTSQKFLASSPTFPTFHWQEQRRSILRDAKRRTRNPTRGTTSR